MHTNEDPTKEKQSPLREIVQPFVDLVHASRALWGVNLGYLIEGLVYFGMLGYLAIYFSDFVFSGVPHADELSHQMVMVLTAGITASMFVLGFVPDRWGVRFGLIFSFCLLVIGRVVIAGAPTLLGLKPEGLWSPLHMVTLLGILIIVVGYGIYQPAAYAAVRQFTTPKTAAMGFAMLYALMNLGGWLPTFAFLIRDEDFLGLGIIGTFWIYTGLTVVALVATVVLLTRDTVEKATRDAKSETDAILSRAEETGSPAQPRPDPGQNTVVPGHIWLVMLGFMACTYLKIAEPFNYYATAALLAGCVVLNLIPATRIWLARHPLSDAKFCFFIFALVPVQTLFTYNWLVLPQYISRSYEGWIGEYFEIASNANPLLIFVAVPIITAATQRVNVYSMMIWGTLVMAAPAFLLVLGPYAWALLAYILIMTIGEAMWQPRFLQYAAEIAPEGRTGEYMGVAQFPWFLTKMLVPWLYSGWMMDRYCPAEGAKNTEVMWLIFGLIAITSPLFLVLARGWAGKDFDAGPREEG
ncbi:MAG: MFS transporter [Armatimonadetes bacterium]|nr:MFS transporter [Armatimonadota bacterium]